MQSFFLIEIPNTKTNVRREFAITSGNFDGVNLLELFRKYYVLRPSPIETTRFFVGYRNGKCTKQVVGINTIAGIPKKIADFLELQNSSTYTGHSFRRTSATLLADSGADITVLKRHGNWKSSSVAESYIENSIENKIRISSKIVGEKQQCCEEITNGWENSSEVIKEQDVLNMKKSDGSDSSQCSFKNCSNFVVNIYKQ